MILFDLFNEYDEDGSGSISLQELKGHFDDRVEDDQYKCEASPRTHAHTCHRRTAVAARHHTHTIAAHCCRRTAVAARRTRMTLSRHRERLPRTERRERRPRLAEAACHEFTRALYCAHTRVCASLRMLCRGADSETRDGERTKSFAQRRAERTNLDLAALVQPMFESADKDHSGTVEFLELLKVLYPAATAGDMETFKQWCYPVKPCALALAPPPLACCHLHAPSRPACPPPPPAACPPLPPWAMHP